MKTYFLLFIILFVFVVAAGCEKPQKKTAAGSSVKIGIIGPMSGPDKEWGKSCLDGIKTALKLQPVLDNCNVIEIEDFVTKENLTELLSKSFDYVIDAIDSLNPKVQLLKAAHRRSIPTFSSMGAALRTDPGHINVSDISKTKNCPLARRIRKRLKKEDIYTGITCVYSTEPVDFEYPPLSEHEQKSGPSLRGRGRRTLGSLPTLTALFGLILANEVIRFVAKKL